MSTTVTVKSHDTVVVFPSSAVRVTVVVPTGIVDPGIGTCVTVSPAAQLSAATPALKSGIDTSHVAAVAPVKSVVSPGQVSVGAMGSMTLTVAVQESTLPDSSVTKSVTVLAPMSEQRKVS